MTKAERAVKKIGKVKFPKGTDLRTLKRRPRIGGNTGLSMSDEFRNEWFILPTEELCIYKTYDNSNRKKPIAKAIKNVRMYNELLCAKLCDIVGIKHARYECAHYENTTGLISYNILGKHESMASIIRNTSMLGSFIEQLKVEEKESNNNIREILRTLYSYMLFDIRTLQTDRNRNNAPLVRNNITGELRVGELLDSEYAYLANCMIWYEGGDTFFGVYDKNNGVDATSIINKYNSKMEFGGYYTLNVDRVLKDRSLDSMIEDCCNLAAMSPELNKILENFMKSFDARLAIDELKKEGVIPTKGYEAYVIAIDDYIKERFNYYLQRKEESVKKYTESVPEQYTSLSRRFEIMYMLDMARSASVEVSDSIYDNYELFHKNVRSVHP